MKGDRQRVVNQTRGILFEFGVVIGDERVGIVEVSAVVAPERGWNLDHTSHSTPDGGIGSAERVRDSGEWPIRDAP